MKRLFLIIAVVFITQNIFGLNFQKVISQLDETYDVQSALLEVQRLKKEVKAFVSPEDFNLAINPSLKATSLEDGIFGEEIELYGTASLKLPLGLSDLEKEKLNFAINSLKLAESELETTRQRTFIKLYSLYQHAWLLQEEEPVVKLELAVAENYSELMQQRFKSGTVSLIILAAADETLQEKTDGYSQNLLEQRLALYELMFNANLEIEPETLEKNSLEIKDIPKPSELGKWVEDNHPLLEIERVRVNQLKQTIERMRKPDLDISVKPFLNYNDHSASLSYSINDPEITGAYSFPVYTYGEIPVNSGNSVSTWNTGVTVNISLGSNKSDTLNTNALILALQSSEAKIDYLKESLNLGLRSSYQQYIRNQGVFDQSKRDLIRISENQKIIKTKNDLGQASEFDLIEAEALKVRGDWKIESARINTEISWLSVLEDAVWFEKSGLDF